MSDNQASQEQEPKRGVGRPLGTKMLGRPPTMLVKTDHQKINELKKLLLDGAGELVVTKAIEIAMNDNHPAQAAMIKLCMDKHACIHRKIYIYIYIYTIWISVFVFVCSYS